VSSQSADGAVRCVRVADIAVQGPRRRFFGADEYGIKPKQDLARSAVASCQSDNGKCVGTSQRSLADHRSVGQRSPDSGRRFDEGITGKNLCLGQAQKTLRHADIEQQT
jgi:hypothetical protein